MEIYEVVVIGAGIMGSSAAYYASKNSGSKVLLLEQFDRLHRRGSSHGDSRIIRYAYPEDFNASLMPDAYKTWAQIELESNTKLFTKTGSLSIGKKDHPDIQSTLKNFQKFEIPYKIFTPATIGFKFPTIRLPESHDALYQKDGGILNASKAVATIQLLAEKNGCKFLDNAPVLNLAVQKFPHKNVPELVKIETPRGTFYSKKCIVTAGGWTQKLLKKNVNADIPLQPEQTTIGYFRVDEPNRYSSSNFPVFLTYSDDEKALSVYGLPALEYPNMLKCAGDTGVPCDPDRRTFEPDLNGILNTAGTFLKQFFVGVAETPTLMESCMYTLSPDRQFIIDILPGSNIVVGCGFSGHGFKLGPLIGNILSQLATTGVHPYPHVIPHFSANRFKNKL